MCLKTTLYFVLSLKTFIHAPSTHRKLTEQLKHTALIASRCWYFHQSSWNQTSEMNSCTFAKLLGQLKNVVHKTIPITSARKHCVRSFTIDSSVCTSPLSLVSTIAVLSVLEKLFFSHYMTSDIHCRFYLICFICFPPSI